MKKGVKRQAEVDIFQLKCLITIGESAHARQHAEDVVVRRVDADRRGRGRADRIVGHREHERGVVDAGQVARAAGLVLLGGEGERVHVDADGRHVRVVLVRLHLVEVASLADREPVVAVELDERRDDRVLAGHALDARDGVARLQRRPVPPVGVVERLLALPEVDDRVVAADERVALDNPHKLLARVVEVELQPVRGGVDGLGARELQGLDQVLVGDLGELAALIRVEVDVVDVERGGDQVGRVHARADGVDVAADLRGRVEHQVLQVVELQVDAHLVVLERDQRERQARVAAEPELERHVERVLRRAGQELARRVRLAARAVIVARLTALGDEVGELRHVANHLRIAGLLARLLRELVPDVEPVAIVLVDALAADLQLNPVDEVVANPVEPAELGARAVAGLERHRRQGGLQVHAVDQVTVALDRARDLVAEAGVAVERVLDGLHREVRVAAVDHLEKGDLGVAREVNVLGAVGDELHKTTTRHFCISLAEKKILEQRV